MGFFADIKGWLSGEDFHKESPSQPVKRETETSGTTPRTGGSYYNWLLPLYGSNAMSVATVFACVRHISEAVANLPVQYLKRKDGVYVEEFNRLHYLLNVQPDIAINGFDFWRKVVQEVLLEGNAYIVPIYSNVTMDIDRLALCGRGTVAHDEINDTYTVTDVENGISGTFDEDEIIHIKGQILNGYKHGLSVLHYASLTVGIASAGDNETRNRFTNGGNVRGLVSNGNSIRGFGEYADDQLEATAEDIDGQFYGGKRIVSLPGQVDFKQISLTSTDMQFLESRKFTVREICRFFGVHPSFVFDDTSNNYKSVEMANVAFLSHTLNPLLRKIEIELQRKLVSPSRYSKVSIRFDRQGIYACDLDAKVKYMQNTIAAGIYTPNEWRISENKKPVDGGDKVLVSANLKSIDDPTLAMTKQPTEE